MTSKPHLYIRTALSCLVVLGFAQISHAQDAGQASAETSDVTSGLAQATNIYTPDYFTQYAPRTALDMVARIPGFSISNGSSGKRGLGQGGANVLINGKRISGKTSANDRLSRINTTSVVRIEILDGAALDIPGLSGQIANIVYKTLTVNGNWKWTPWFRKHIEPNLLRGEVNLSGQTGDLQWSLALRNRAFRFGNRGKEFRRLADGTLIETRDEISTFSNDSPTLATTLNWMPKPNHVVNLNAEISKSNFEIREFSDHDAFTERGDNNATSFNLGRDNLRAEIGGDYSFPFGSKVKNGTLKLIGLARYLTAPSRASFVTLAGQTRSGERRFSTDNKTSEAVLRSEYSWSDAKQQNWQFSLEAAYNRLNADGGLQILNTANGQFIDIPLAGSTASVSEKRGEATLAHTLKITPSFDIQASIGAEYSEIQQISTTNNVQRSFFRPKGFVQASYKLGENFTIRPRLARDVGQLNFNDFISSVSLRDELASTGNGNLVPEQIWASELELERKFAYGNIVTVRFYADFISDLVDRIPVGVDGDAVGNIDTARRYGVDINGTFKGEAIRLDGMQIDMTLDLRDSNVDDPLTNIPRRLNGDKISFWKIALRHDIKDTNWAYGGNISEISKGLVYRLDTISTPGGGDLQTKPRLSAFIEHKNILGLKVNAEITNILDGQDISNRQLFTDRRDIGVLDITESSRRDFGQTLRLNISGAF